MKSIIDKQTERLLEKFPTAKVIPQPDFYYLVHIPDFKLGEGWNKKETNLYFILPSGFPIASPADFMTDEDLTFANGGTPRQSQTTTMLKEYGKLLQFTFRVHNWNPHVCDILTYVRTIELSLRERDKVEFRESTAMHN